MSLFSTYSALSKNGYQSTTPEGAGVWKVVETILDAGQPPFEVRFNYDGNLMAIGRYTAVAGNLNAAGKVDIYSNDTGPWLLLDTLTEPTPVIGGGFGRSIDFDQSGNYIAITSVSYGNGGNLYIYNRTGNTWSEQANIQPFSNVSPNVGLVGVAISNNCNYIVAGGYGNLLANVNGLARIYTYANSTATFQQELNPNVVNFTASFYQPELQINGDGDKILTSQIPPGYYTSNTQTNANVYYYTRSNTTWSLHTTFSGNIANSGFGTAYGLADSGNYIAINAPFNYANGGNIIQVYSNVSNVYTVNQTITGNNVGGGVLNGFQYAPNETWLITGMTVDTVYDRDIDFLQKDGNGNYIFSQGLFNPGYQIPIAISGSGNYLAVWDALDYPPNFSNFAVVIYSNE